MRKKGEEKKITSLKITKSTKMLMDILIQQMDIPRTFFHRRAIDYFLENHLEIQPELLIRERSNPKYVKKDAVETLYLDDARKEKLKKIAEENGCGYTVVVFNAFMVYCSVVAPAVLGDNTINKLLTGKAKEEDII